MRFLYAYSNAAMQPGPEEGDMTLCTIAGVFWAKDDQEAHGIAMSQCLMNYPTSKGYIGHAKSTYRVAKYALATEEK